ncbi:E3 SUMO-protein ligase ZBED1 [Manis javanica]|nr:E3 SUMO-protein ligase ZBED1 [Manis javanica]
MKQEEQAERERSRPPRLRLGQEKRVLQHSRPQALNQDGKKTLCSSTRAQVGSRLLWGQEAQVIGEWSAWSREPVRDCPLL